MMSRCDDIVSWRDSLHGGRDAFEEHDHRLTDVRRHRHLARLARVGDSYKNGILYHTHDK